MRRILRVLTAAALMAVIMGFSSGPAFAQDEFVSDQGGVFELEKKVFDQVCFIFPALCSDDDSDDGSDDDSDDGSSSAGIP